MAISNETSARVLNSLRKEFVERVIPSHMTDCLAGFLELEEEEEVRAKVSHFGETHGAEHLWSILIRKPDWFGHLVEALYHKHVDLPDLAEKFMKERGCLPVHINIRAISHQQGPTIFKKPEEEESPMDIDEEVDYFATHETASDTVLEATMSHYPITQTCAQPQPVHGGGKILSDDNKRMLLDRFNVILQGAASAEGKSIIEETLRNLELKLIAVRTSSVVLLFEPLSLEALGNTWDMHKSGVLAKIIHQTLVTEQVMRKLRRDAAEFGIELGNIHLTTLIKNMEFISLTAWLTEQRECIVVQSQLETFCLYGKSLQVFHSSYIRDEKIRQLKALRKHLPESVRQMVEDPFIRDDFLENAIETILRIDEETQKDITASRSSLQRALPDKEGRRLVSEVMNWISTIYDDRLSKFDEKMLDVLNTLALITMGNVCVHDDETIQIEEKYGLFQLTLKDDVNIFLREELIHLTKRMHFDVPNTLLTGLETGIIAVPMDIQQLVTQDILCSVPTREGRYRFVSLVLRDFLIGASICYKTFPAIQRDVKTSLLQYFHKFNYLHVPVCNPVTCQAAQSHNQVVINVYKELEKNDPDKADEFASTLLCSLEFCNRPEAKGWLEYFGSKLKLVHSEGTLARPGVILSKQTKRFLSLLVYHDILYKFMVCDADVIMSTKLSIKSKLEDFMKDRHFVFRGKGILLNKTEADVIAIIRSIQVLDFINFSGQLEISDEKLICELEKKSPVSEIGISLDLSCSVMTPTLLQNLDACFSTLSNIVGLFLVNIGNLSLHWLRRLLSKGCLPNLKSLDLSENKIFKGMNRSLGIRFCPALTELILAKCALGDIDLEFVCEEIESLTKLRKLDISDNEFTVCGLVPLNKAISGKHIVTHLNLSGNTHCGQNTGCGLVLATILKGIRLLEVLGLRSFHLDNEGITVIVQHLPSTLKQLDLTGNIISESNMIMFQEIQRQFPYLQIMGL